MAGKFIPYLILILLLSHPSSSVFTEEEDDEILLFDSADFSLNVVNKCSDDLQLDFMEVPGAWIGTVNHQNNNNNNNNSSKTEQDVNNNSTEVDWIQFDLIHHDPCITNGRMSQTFNLYFDDPNPTTMEYFTHHGYFRGGAVYYPPGAYCVQNVTAQRVEMKTCTPNCHQDLCFPKCCPPGHVLSQNLSATVVTASVCATVEEDWSPFLYHMLNDTHGKMRLENDSSSAKLTFYSVWKPPKCSLIGLTPHANVHRKNSFEILVLESGHVYTRSKLLPYKGWHASMHNRFCIDGLWDTGDSDVFIPDESNQVVWACRDRKPVSKNRLMLVQIIFVLLCISSFCLFVTVLAYLLLWNRQNAHGWSITAFCFSVMADYALFSAGLGLLLFNPGFVNTLGCQIMGIAWHFCYLASFSWMTVLSFDVWKNINLTTTTTNFRRSSGKRRFIFYSLYGFGLPLAIVGISLAIEHHVPTNNINVVRPEYGRLWCGVSAISSFYYSTLAALVIFAVSGVIAFLVFKSLRDVTRGSLRADKYSTIQKKNMGLLLAKLFLFMGTSILLNFTVAFMKGDVAKWMNIIFLVITILRGMAIAYVFVSDKRIIFLLLQKIELKLLKSRSAHPTLRSSPKPFVVTLETEMPDL